MLTCVSVDLALTLWAIRAASGRLVEGVETGPLEGRVGQSGYRYCFQIWDKAQGGELSIVVL